MSFFTRTYSLNHCRHVMQEAYKLYLKHGRPNELKEKIAALQQAVEANERAKADQLARELETLIKARYQKSWGIWALELALALGVALIVATVIRQMWFELYEIPTGSMRPTFKEQDHLTVSKTQFGINVPLKTSHFYFDPELVERTGTIIFSGDGLPLRDTDTTFMGIFPYKKRYVKRLIGKPEDSFLFYGGQLYAQNAQGNALGELLTDPGMEKLEHIPFIGFEGQPQRLNPDTIVFSYFNIPLARVIREGSTLRGEIFDGSKWVPDQIESAKQPHSKVSTLSDLIGMRHYAMAQLYTKNELNQEGLKSSKEGELFLVLRHTPNLDYTKGVSSTARLPKVLTTVLPLQQEDLATLMQNMYTARFVVSNGSVKRYSLETIPFTAASPRLEGVPDGTYEFYYGKAYQVHLGGITSELPSTHPLYTLSPERVQLLFNLGIQWEKAFQPNSKAGAWPNRYAYYRHGDLYLLGAPFLKKDTPRLNKFVEQEKKLQEEAPSQAPYVAFIDKGAPTPDQFKSFGLQVPVDHYMVLGDNHAMSGDSRVFGFVPQANLQGVPDLILWPPGDRLGHPVQKSYPLFVLPRFIIWIIASVIAAIAYAIYCYRLRKPIHL